MVFLLLYFAAKLSLPGCANLGVEVEVEECNGDEEPSVINRSIPDSSKLFWNTVLYKVDCYFLKDNIIAL